MTRALALLLATALLGGCASFDETYLFTASSPDVPFTQYYRVKIGGFGFLASSEFASGLYDAQAVDALFGEMEGGMIRIARPQPPGGDTETDGEEEQGDAASPPAPAADELKSLDGQSMGDRKLVLFLSSKADGLVKRIKAFAASQDVTSGLTALLLKEDIAEVKRARAVQPAKDARAEAFASVLDTTAASVRALDGTTSSDLAADLRGEALKGLQTLARQVEPGVTFADLPAAQAWFADNQGSLREVLD